MLFNEFINKIKKIDSVELPSSSSHHKMAPTNRDELLKKSNLENKVPREAAVMMLFYPVKNQTNLVLIKRASYNGVHSSQIAFPGGKIEIEDKNTEEAALRETYEEIGIHPHNIQVIKAFSKVFIPPSNFIVYPFLGISTSELEFLLQKEEVVGIIQFPLIDLLDDTIIIKKNITTSYASNVEVPGFQIENHFVWGATAMMLSELKDVLKMII